MAINFKKLLQEERRKAALKHSSSSESQNESKAEELPATIFQSTEEVVRINKKRLQLQLDSEFRLENFRLATDIPKLYYIPDAISPDDERFLIDTIDLLGSKYKHWHVLKSRRLQQWGTFPSTTNSCQIENTGTEDKQRLSGWLESIVEELLRYEIFPSQIHPDNALINQYEAHEGILHHTDGPSYHNYVAILSLESTCVMTFKPKLSTTEIGIQSDADVASIILQPRSLFLFTEDFYDNYMHGIYPNEELQIVGNHAPCVNCAAAGVTPGTQLPRRSRRTSITLRQIKST